MAHARAYRRYQTDYLATQGGQVGITLNIHWAEPDDPDSPEHLEASERVVQFALGWFANPIFVNGEYPEVMRTQVDRKSELQGFPESRLPFFSAEDQLMVTNSSGILTILQQKYLFK